MNLKVAIKLVALLSALTATIVAIFWLNQGHMDSFWTSLGVDRRGTRLNWCVERVDSLYLYESQEKLIEEDGQWLWQKGDQSQELDYLRVEKWFAKYCQIPIDEKLDASKNRSPFKPFLEARFIDGSRKTLSVAGSTSFRIDSHLFRSETLRKGIKELLAFGKKIE